MPYPKDDRIPSILSSIYRNDILVGVEIDESGVESGAALMMKVMIDVAFGDEAEGGQFLAAMKKLHEAGAHSTSSGKAVDTAMSGGGRDA